MTNDFLELGWKSFVLLVLAAVVAFALRKQSAGAKHLVWKLACLSLLVLPAGQAWMPGWNVLPEEWFMVSFDPSPSEKRPIAARHNPPDTAAKNQAVSTEPAQTRISMNPFPDPVSTPNVRVRTREETVIVGGEPRIFRPIDRVEMPSAILWRFNAALKWAVVIWGCIACVLMLRLLASVFMLWRKTSQLPVMTDEPLVTLVASLRNTLCLKKTVDVRLSTPETMPMVWGLRQPVIIVPETITSWPIEQQRSVLLHELAHVKRRDPLWQVVVELTKVIYWPQPVLWFALRQIERLREQACDDLVLNSGVCAADYARSLLDVVSQGRLRRIWPAVGVAIVSTPSIEMRLKTILDRTVNRFAVSRRMAMIVVIAAISTTVILTSFRLTVPSLVDEPIAKDSLTKAVIQESSKQEENPVEEKPVEVAPLQKERRQIVLEFYGEDGKPVQGAKVDIVGLRTLANHASSYGWSDKFHGSKPVDVSNEKGEITIDFPEFVLEKMRTSVLSILVTHPEFAAKNRELNLMKQNRRNAPVYLTRQRLSLQRGVVYQISLTGNGSSIKPQSTHVMFNNDWSGEGQFRFQPPNLMVSGRIQDQAKIAQVVHRTDAGQLIFSDVISTDRWRTEGDQRIIEEVPLFPGHLLSGIIDEAVPRPVVNGLVLAQCVYLDSTDANNRLRLTWNDAAEIQPDGSFKFDSLPRNVPVQLVAICDGWCSSQPQLNELRTIAEFAPYIDQRLGVDGVSLWPQLVSASQNDGVVISMDKTNSVTLKCLDPEGKPIAGAKLGLFPNLSTFQHGSTLFGPAWGPAQSWVGKDSEEVMKERLERHLKSSDHWSKLTNEDGEAAFTGLPNITYVYGAMEHPQYQIAMPVGSVHRTVNIPVIGAVEPFIIRAERIGEKPMGELAPAVEEADEVEAPAENENAYSVSSSIRDGEEKPLRGVKATLYQWTASSKTQTFAAETLSNDEGTFSFSNLEPPSGDRGILIESQPQTKFFDRFYKLQLTKEGYATEMTPIGYNSMESLDVELTMRKSGVLTGKVMDEKGLPLADVLVAQKFNEWPETDGIGRRARTNRNGEYRIDDLPIWNQKNAKSVDQGNGTGWMEIASPLIIDHPGYAHVEVYYQQIPGELDIVLYKENVVEGVVVNQTDQSPIRDCPIKLSKLNWTGKEGQAVTGENGSFRFEGLPAGAYSLSVDSADHISFPVDFKFAGHGEVKTAVQVAVTKGGWLEGSIVNHATGKPHLEITPGVKTTISIERNSKISSRPVWVRNVTVQSDGSFRTCLPPGTYLPRVSGDRNTSEHFENWDVWTKGINVRAGETTRLELRYHAEEIPGDPKVQAVELELPVSDEVEVANAIRRLGGWYELNDDKRIKTINMVYYDDKTRDFRLDNSQTEADECMQWAAKCTALTVLALTEGQVTDASMKYMSGMKLLEQLFVWDAKKLTDEGIRSLRGLENLKEIHFSDAKLGDGSLETFGTLPKLEKLALQGNSFTDDGFRHLVGLTHLKSMWVGMNTPKLTDRAIDHVSKLKLLEQLDLQQAAISQSGFLKLSGCRELTKLMVGGMKVADSDAIDDDCLETILAFPRLKDLWITPCRLSESACDRLLKESQISSLNVGSSEIAYGYQSNARRRFPDRRIDIHTVEK